MEKSVKYIVNNKNPIVCVKKEKNNNTCEKEGDVYLLVYK